MSDRILIYGAYGYTGDLTARLAREQGVDVILAGRNSTQLEPLAAELDYEARVLSLADGGALAAALADVAVVIHAAGPFSRTSAPMADACLATGTHYTDITGEIGVFEALAARDAEARSAGVMLMPGTGFDVVPSDCLANHLAARLPGAVSLAMAAGGLGAGISHGTALTAVENLGRGAQIRRSGRLQRVRTGKLWRDVDFGRGPKACTAIPWGDLSTAFASTGIGDITFYAAMPRALKVTGFIEGALGTRPVQALLKRLVDRRGRGPTVSERAGATTTLWGEVRDAAGQTAEALLTVPEGYTLTAQTSLDIAKRVVAGEVEPGYRTPAMVYGADYILGFEGVERRDR